MKGIICYYSGSGNTKLAIQYIAKKMKNIEIDLFNIVKDSNPNLDNYNFVGFATFTDFWGPPYLIQTFIEQLTSQNNKPAFIFNTYGFFSGKTLKIFEKWVKEKGFNVIAGHSLHTPESYPPMVAKGRGYENNPDEKELTDFNNFITKLETIINTQLKEDKEIIPAKIKNSLLLAFSRTKARRNMGEKYVDENLCTECGTCEKTCPYNAIILNSKPIFDMTKCYGCWGCFNHCPNKAIYTKKFREVGQYPKPSKQLIEKLKDK
jgi:NAD-dependent dihydropyrimidine dehydrogenase PreA subunit